MENFVAQFSANPLLYIEYALSACAAVGILLVLGGIGGAMSHLFNYSSGADHMEHTRTRTLWGLYLCMAVLGIWEFIRLMLGELPFGAGVFWVVVLLSPLWAPWLKHTLFPTK